MDRAVIVLTTFESREDAVRVVRTLVEERLAACGNIVPGVESVYRWQDRIESASEVLVLLKCLESRVTKLQERLLELHPYEVPEFIALSPADLSPAYLSWLRDACGG